MHPQISSSPLISWICSILIATHAQSLPLAMLEMHPQMSISHMNQWIFLNTHFKHTQSFSLAMYPDESMDSVLLIVQKKWSRCFWGNSKIEEYV
jgi:hypothetical protein